MHKTVFTLTHRRSSIAFIVACLCTTIFFLSACRPVEKKYNYSIFAFGTLIDVTLYATDQQQADNAFNQLQKLFDKHHQDWSPWTNGDLAQLNKKLKTQTTATVPPHLIPIIQTSIRLSQQSDNYYNPAIGQLINLWQFHKYQDNNVRPPDDARIKNLVKKNPRMNDLVFSTDKQITNTNPAVMLNFGAFAKGYAIKLGLEHLQTLGIHSAVINAGGDLSVIGQHDDRAWNIGIRHPRNEKVLASVEVRNNENVFTSGDYERAYTFQSKRFHHILDPKTGYPATDMQSVTVIHTDAGLADAAATALFVAGRKDWYKIAKKMNIHQVMLIDADGDIHLTPDMENRLNFRNKSPTSRIIVSKEL